MPVIDAVQTFAGIANENEFYSHHYLAEVFNGDIKARLDAWDAAEAEHPGDEAYRTPQRRLQAWAQRWFSLRGQIQRARDEAERWQIYTQIQSGLLQALAYAAPPDLPTPHELVAGLAVPMWHLQLPRLAIIPAYQPGAEADDLLDHKLQPRHYGGDPVPKHLQGETWADMLSDAVFGADTAPRYVLLTGLDHWLLLDRYKWPNNRALRFDWPDIFDRKDSDTLKACAALLHKDCLAPAEGASLLESLDENAHKHAFGVSEDLKYALREAIELLGNEAATQLRQQAADAKKGFFSGKDQLDPGDLSLECLRMVYRLLFMFYIEARPELGYVPIGKSDVYLKGYSLESLRELEMQPLNTPHARDGLYFDATLRRLFRLVAQGCGLGEPVQAQLVASVAGAKDTFALAPLDSRLFDNSTLPMLGRVRFPNHVWQRIIRLMSLSRAQGRGRRSGRVSYQLLSINQLGAVYEALLSYRGFFAADDLYEVKPASKKGRAAESDDDPDDEDGDGPDDDATPRRVRGGNGGSEADMLETAWFVPASRLKEYREDERVYDINEAGHRMLRKHAKGSFIYHLAGRDRQKSASYYTPQVLTQCLVKYALKELLSSERVTKADDILTLTVCEPAMGSAAFLNEAVNQLADAYLERKQAELGRRIPHDDYPRELQKVRMVLADRNVFGVDLNPVAVELAEVSLWLNAIYGEEDEEKRPLPARVPWFGYQLFAGNSLIGARAQVYKPGSLRKGAKPAWHEEPPRQVTPAKPRQGDEIWHFLLPDPGMADYTDKEAKKLYPADFERLKAWRRAFCAPLGPHEVARLQQLSAKAQELWDEHTKALARDRGRTEDPLDVWPHRGAKLSGGVHAASRAEKEAIRRQGLLNEDGDLATPFRWLKLVMDYWCALWFWPITDSVNLPSREEWWMEVGAVLEGNVVDITVQPGLDFQAARPEPAQELAPKAQASFAALEAQPSLLIAADPPRPHDKLGQLRISRLREHFSRVSTVEDIAATRRFMHWDLVFADILLLRGGFDLIAGNPPWIRVEWNESGVLSERNPVFAIRKVSASDLVKLRAEAFRDFSGLREVWTEEFQEADGTQNFLNATQNYPMLRGMKANLYKCFIPLAWNLSGTNGISALLHAEGPYDDLNGAMLRATAYMRLRRQFRFVNELKLFSEVHNQTRFSINIYGDTRVLPGFDQISNLFTPTTVDACYQHAGTGAVGGYKTEDGRWNTGGHSDRIVRVDIEALTTYAQLYDAPGISPFHARLPALHAGALNSVLAKLAKYPRRLQDIGDNCYSSYMFDENMSQQEGTLFRRKSDGLRFAQTPEDAIVSGPHFFVANPLNKTARRVCSSNKAYDVPDLEILPDDYLPRTNYHPMADRVEYLRRIPRVSWLEAGQEIAAPATNYFRAISRTMIGPSSERTLITALIPPKVAHIDLGFSITFRSSSLSALVASSFVSIPYDFYVKSTGKSHFRSDIASLLPLLDEMASKVHLIARGLALNCLTTYYAGRMSTISPSPTNAGASPTTHAFRRISGIRTPDGKMREGNFGWEDLYKDGTVLVPDGTVVTQWVTDDTLPGGPRTVERTYTAPFARANREDDYRTAEGMI